MRFEELIEFADENYKTIKFIQIPRKFIKEFEN
jgi:hypothetical protein